MKLFSFGKDLNLPTTLIEAIERAFGANLWGIQLRIALEQLAGGLERQKRYTAKVRSIYKRGFLNFVAYHTSVRNEGKSTHSKFIEDVKARIDRHQYYDDPIKSYLRQRLANEWPSTESGWADILRIEQSHGLIDIYETFVSAVQELVRREDMIVARQVALKCLRRIPPGLDFRLDKAMMLLDKNQVSSEFPARNTDISDLLLSGQSQKAAFLGRIQCRAKPIDAWNLIYTGFAFADRNQTHIKEFNLPVEIPRMIGGIQSDGSSAENAIAQLNKLATNLRGLPFTAAIADLIPHLRRQHPDDQWQPWLIGLNCPTLGIEDFHHLDSSSTPPKLDGGPTNEVWANFHSKDVYQNTANLLAGKMLAASRLISNRSFDEALKILRPLRNQLVPKPLKSILINLILHAEFGRGSNQDVIELIADECSHSQNNRILLPILPSLSGFAWADYKAVRSPLAPSIALKLLWSFNDSELTMSQLRFAVGMGMRACGVDRPSQLRDEPSRTPKRQLIYFLHDACIPQVLDVSRVLKSSREVLEERQAIFAVLREIDPCNSSEHADEMMSISNQLAIADGQWIVDRTRIHVDTEALERWANKELSEDFERYQDLLSVEVGGSQSFDEVLKELTDPVAGQRQATIPDNEADAVLLSILRRLGEEFLGNPTFGLDFYLSKRIRHQSFIGRIRGPLEFSNLITTRESETGAYHRNDIWVNKFTTCSTDAQDAINRSLVSCASTFDETLKEAKDRRLHVRSTEQPDGLLVLGITTSILRLARSVVSARDKFSDFYGIAIAILWASLEPSLAETRRYITYELKNKIIDSFDHLRASVREVAENDPAFLEFDAEFGNRSTEVQRALDEAASWFTHTDIEALRRTFTLEQAVSIATENARKSQRAFDPVIEQEVRGKLQVSATSLVFIHDALFIALDNARAHSGLKNPKIKIDVTPNENAETLTLEIRSNYKIQNRISKEKDLKEVRQTIEAGHVSRRTKREGGSGFLKLNAVVKQSPRGLLEFGFTDDGDFRLAVTYSIVMHPRTEVASNA
ncbi:hypothetical protein FV218_07040 [Methylobacterium sp. WL69]|uniref:hypothetical protein n=1 Tax=Methylobacterium sp. WL69 TaxID=2603893 RepID=UPI0011C9AAC4|nr:hypothetical protein [Methylobacterium sp. WL69]TXM76510.1 hypothetical protein FV218_07040 [Methylobacterium sp. WL69]